MLQTTEAGGQTNFSVVLDSQPLTDVVLAVESSNASEGRPTADSVTFTTENWNRAQSITIVGQDDNQDDGEVEYTMTIRVGDALDATYANLKVNRSV